MLLHLDEILTLALNGSSCLYMDGLAWAATQTSTWMLVAVMLMYVIIRNNELSGVVVTLLGLALCILVADQVASTVFKPLAARYRPTNDPFLMYSIDVVNGYRSAIFEELWFWEHFYSSTYFWIVTISMFCVGTLVFRRMRSHFADVL